MRRLLFLILAIMSATFISCNTADDTTMYDVTVSVDPSDAGIISPSADSSYEEGEEITLRAKPSDEYLFEQWSGDKESSDRFLSITVDQDYSITADFKVKEYELATNTEGEGSVYEEVIQQKNKEYEHGTIVELTAEPDEGWEFVEWQGDITGTENPAEITVDNAKEVSAVFEKIQVNLQVYSGNNQRSQPGSELEEPLTIQTLDQNDEPESDILVEFNIVEGKGTITKKEVTTNNEGLAETSLRLSDELGSTVVEAKTKNLSPGVKSEIVEFKAVAETKLSEWLANHDRVVDAINWETPNGNVINYRDWTDDQKSELKEMYSKVASNSLTMDNYPPENMYSGGGNVQNWIKKDDAWNLYLMNITGSIAFERSNTVNWSISDSEYSKEDLNILFDSQSFYAYKGVEDGKDIYEPVGGSFMGRVLPAQPNFVLDFFKSQGILASDRKETVYRLIDWSAVNLRHYTGHFSMDNAEDHWHYAGAIPVDRIIDGTNRDGDNTDEIYHLTAGCHGTNHFYISILRTINIPVQYERRAGHATPHFTVEDLYLSHGDDPYNAFYARKPAIHPKELLIDKQTFKEWFSYADNSRDEIANNIGRRSLELGVENISHYLLQLYCADKNDDATREEGRVFDTLSHHYTMSELEEMNLWEKMDDKLSSIGGCENIDNERPPYY